MPDGVARATTTELRLENLSPVPVKSASTTGRKTPVREFLLFPWGDIDTCYGVLKFDKDAAAQIMEKYRARTERRDGWLDIDIAHLSQTNDDEPMAHVSAGKFRTETRADGQWVTDLTYTPDMFELVATEVFKYYSPVVHTDDEHRIVELLQLALTNIPAMYNAQPLALSDKNKKGTLMSQDIKPGKFSRVAMASVCLDSRKVRLEEAGKADASMSAARPHMARLFQALYETVYNTMPNAHVEEVYEDHVILGIPGRPGNTKEQYVKASYSVGGDGQVSLGEPVKVVKRFAAEMPMESAEADGYEEVDDKMEQLSQKAKNVEQMLLSATGMKTVSAAIGEIERLKTSGGKDLAEKVAMLEARSFDAEKQVLLSSAKKSGKWTVNLEKLALANADRAKRLGEDPIAAMRETFDAAPVSVYQGRETPPEHDSTDSVGGQMMTLSANDRKQLEQDAARYGVDPKAYVSRFLENSKSFKR